MNKTNIKHEQITLNCDLGETDLITQNSIEHKVMPLIDMANIACGAHAGNEQTMRTTLELAKRYSVIAGAHPSYPDRANFGRVSLTIDHKELQESLYQQISSLVKIALELDYPIYYVKPHGALYNDMAQSIALAELVFSVVAFINKKFDQQLQLMVIASAIPELEKLAQQYQVQLLAEAFIDRRYQSNGRLTPRKMPSGEANPDAVLDQEEALFQALFLVDGTVMCDDGHAISLSPSSLCVHGDNEAALTVTRVLKSLLELPITLTRPSDRSLKITANERLYSELLSPLAIQLTQYFPTQIVAATPAFNSLFLETKPGELDSILLINSTLRIFKNLLTEQQNSKIRHHELPICYDIMSSDPFEQYNDLTEISKRTGLSEQEVISTHLNTTYRVESIGFAPGFAYMSGLPTHLQVPRKTTPRTSVPKGAVAIANDMSCIYPQPSPGGWNILGLCPVQVFDFNNEDSPVLYQVGDSVSYRAISKEEYTRLLDQNPHHKKQLQSLPTHKKDTSTTLSSLSAKLLVTKLGTSATIQDGGRVGVSHFGLSVGGAADQYAFQWANRLLGNDMNAPAIEFVFGNIELTCLAQTQVCFTGALAPITVNDQPQSMWQTIQLEKDDVIKVGFAQQGLRIYLALQDGVKAKRFWGSASTIIKDQIGTLVERGSVIASASHTCTNPNMNEITNTANLAAVRALNPNSIPNYESNLELNLILSEQFQLFSNYQLAALIQTEFCVSPQSDRMGVRLQSNQSQLKHEHHIQSEGLGLGAVQITPEGEPIVMLADRQSIGGYPKVGYLTQADCNKLAQAQPKTRVRFKLVNHQQAKRYQAQHTILHHD